MYNYASLFRQIIDCNSYSTNDETEIYTTYLKQVTGYEDGDINSLKAHGPHRSPHLNNSPRIFHFF